MINRFIWKLNVFGVNIIKKYIYFRMDVSTTEGVYLIGKSGSFTEWTHFMIVFHGLGDDEGVNGYVNGEFASSQLEIETSEYNENAATTPGNLVLGSTQVNSFSEGQDSSIDEIIWNVELNADEVRELYESYTSPPREV